MTTLEARRIDLLSQLKEAPPPMPRLHPNIADVYRQKVDNLAEALNEERTCAEAAECIRELIEEIRLVPGNGTLRIELYGQLDTSKNPGRIGDRLIHFVRLKTEVLEWLGNRAFLILRSGCESSRRRATISSG
jgi:hypothetical protein